MLDIIWIGQGLVDNTTEWDISSWCSRPDFLLAISWDWSNQYLPFPNNAKCLSRNLPEAILKSLVWLDQGFPPYQMYFSYIRPVIWCMIMRRGNPGLILSPTLALAWKELACKLYTTMHCITAKCYGNDCIRTSVSRFIKTLDLTNWAINSNPLRLVHYGGEKQFSTQLICYDNKRHHCQYLPNKWCILTHNILTHYKTPQRHLWNFFQ